MYYTRIKELLESKEDGEISTTQTKGDPLMLSLFTPTPSRANATAKEDLIALVHDLIDSFVIGAHIAHPICEHKTRCASLQ